MKEHKMKCLACKGLGYINVSGIAARRLDLGLKQEQVAKLSGYNRSTYAMVELGKSTVVSNKIRPLAKALQVTTDELLEMMLGEDK